ncbi:MAG: hypothetical protein GXO96_05220 [Nitrospirae bacterium]|nr:hypothetical protein [Candidatus Manganitrophaceae bacterium]
MSTTAIVWLIAYVTGALMAFVHPIYGLLAYFLTYYQLPKLRWWGKKALPNLRWSLIISLALMAGYFFRRRSLPPLRIKSHPQTKWLVLLVTNAFFVSATTAVWPEKSWENTIEILKYGILYFMIIGTVRTKEHFSYVISMHIFGIFSWGWAAFTNPKRKAGRLYGIGGPDSLHDNSTSSILVAILPFIAATFLTGSKWVKLASSGAAAFALNAFILCNSRGGILALGVESLMALKISKGPMRRNVLFMMVAGGLLFLFLVDPTFIERQTIGEDYGKDGSATSRLDSWMGAIDLVQDYPLGAGGGGFVYLSPIYIPHIVEAHGGSGRNVHSTYFLVLSDYGIQGFIFFIGFILSTFYQLHDIRKNAPETEEGRKIWAYSLAITLGYIGLLTAGAFTSRLMAEVTYWLPAFAAALKNLQVIESEKTTVLVHA